MAEANKTFLFSPLKLREIEFRNRIFVSPMCQYSADDGVPSDWHLVHLGSRAVGGAALVIAEATAVTADGRISLGDSGLWNDEQMNAWKRIAGFIRAQGAVAGVQLAHAGRKASCQRPWEGDGPLTGSDAWTAVAPSAIPFAEKYPTPRALEIPELQKLTGDFVAAARRALSAGFEVIELHFAHGYLLHEFLSPIANKRSDAYGGSRENRMRFPLEVAHAVRQAWPANLPLFVRVSASDWTPEGISIDDTVVLAKELKAIGVDLIDCSSGGVISGVKIPAMPGYQVAFAEQVKREAVIPTGAVGLILNGSQAEDILVNKKADAIILARAMLRDPYWALTAAHELRTQVTDPALWPKQYERAKPR